MDKFLIVRFGSIGNTLVSLPAVRAIKNTYPYASISMIVSPHIDELLSDIKWIDELIVYDMYERHKSLYAYFNFIQQLRKRHFDVAIMFKRFLRSELIGFLSGAKKRIGFETNGKSNFLTNSVPYIEGINIVKLNMMLLKPLGISSDDLSINLSISNCNKNDIPFFIPELKPGSHKSYAVLHPGGKTVKGIGLNVYQYSKIIGILENQYDLLCLIIGDSSEYNTIKEIIKLTNQALTFPVIDISLKKLSCLIKHASIFIGNDSGPCHIADAVGTPGIIIYPPMYNLEEHIKKWKPLGDNYIAILPPKNCKTCERYPCNDNLKARCMEDIDITSILHYTEQILIRGKHGRE